MLLLILAPALAFGGELDGVWRQGCAHGYFREEAFLGDQATYTEHNFWDGSCTQPSVESISRGTISVGQPLAQPAGARAIDFTFSSVSLRPVDERSAAAWRERGVCGYRDWQAGVGKEVTGRECDFFGLGSVVRIPEAGARKFGIVRAGEGALFFGRLTPARDGSTPEKRPLELDPAPYHKAP